MRRPGGRTFMRRSRDRTFMRRSGDRTFMGATIRSPIRYSMKYAQKTDAGARGSRGAPRARAARAVPPSSSSKPPRVRTAGGAARRGRRTPSWSAPAPLATGAAQKRAPATPYTARAPGSAAGRTPVPGAVGRRRMRSLKTQIDCN